MSGFSAHLYSQGVTIITQVASLPLFLSKWSIAEYGIWLTISAIPTYLAFADFGILTHAGNSMTIANARGRLSELNEIFSTAIRGMLIMLPLIAVGACAILLIARKFTPIMHAQAIVWLGLSAILSAGSQVFDAAYRAFGRYPTITILFTVTRFFEWMVSICALFYFGTIEAVACGLFIGRVICMLGIFIHARKLFVALLWSPRNSSNQLLRKLFKSGYGFLAFPVGSMLSIQGITLIVSFQFGPIALALFNSTRTLSRMVIQAGVILGKSLSPEVSALYGARKFSDATALSKSTAFLGLIITTLAGAVIFYCGEDIIRIWSGGHMKTSALLLRLMIFSSIISSIWQIDAVMLTATNNHQKIGASFFIVTMATLIFCLIFPRELGPSGVAGLLLLSELMMLVVVRILTTRFLGTMI